MLIDAHASAVRPDVWPLYERALALTGPVATLIEWDNDVPDWPVLHAEARRADALLADALLADRRLRRGASVVPPRWPVAERDAQAGFAAALLDPAAPPPPGVTARPGPTSPAGSRSTGTTSRSG